VKTSDGTSKENDERAFNSVENKADKSIPTTYLDENEDDMPLSSSDP